jgi:sulfite reductase beta subunit-like hemoprotein
MQRVKIPGGILTDGQWTALGESAERFTPTAPLHLTTRQDVEFHDVRPESVGAIQHALADAGLTAVGACGDTPRNITVCPCSGTATGRLDLMPLAREIQHVFDATPGVFSLPRKFKVSLSACQNACAQPWINDVGFIARRKGGEWGFRAIVAGSLGAKPATGVEFPDWVSARDAPALVAAALSLFAEHGDREHRYHARLRHVRERLGDEAFLRMLTEAFGAAKAERNWPDVPLREIEQGFDAETVLTFANGDITADMARALAGLSSLPEMRVRIANHHRVLAFGKSEEGISRALAAFPALAGAAAPHPAVVACPGTRWCRLALADTTHLADAMREALGTSAPSSRTVCISGCPNGCAHSGVADVGVFGGRAAAGGAEREVYALLAGGEMGRGPGLSKLVAKGLSAEEVVGQVRQYLSPSR